MFAMPHLVAVEFVPLAVVERGVEVTNALWTDEVDESIPDVALVLKVDWQVQKIIFSLVLLVHRG